MTQTTIERYKASSPDAKYLRNQLKAYTDNLRADVVRPILGKYNLNEINSEKWMDAQVQLDMLRDVESQCSFEELVAVGMKRGEYLPVPPEINSLEMILEAAPQAYQGGIKDCSPEEKVSVEKLDINHYRLTLSVPFPLFAMYGSTYGLLRRFTRNGQYLILTIIDKDIPYIFDARW